MSLGKRADSAADNQGHSAAKAESSAHQTVLGLEQRPPSEVQLGSTIKLQAFVGCVEECSFDGETLAIMDGSRTIVDGLQLGAFDGAASETGEVVLAAPQQLGEYHWTVIYRPSAAFQAAHSECSDTISFRVVPHETSLAVWKIDTPIVADGTFAFVVGAKCGAGCSLAGKQISVWDHEGQEVAADGLSTGTYSDELNLFWLQVNCTAPSKPGSYTWKVIFGAGDELVPHSGSHYSFTFRVVPEPKHVLTVDVADKQTGLPLAKAEISVRPHLQRVYANEQGRAEIPLASGRHKVMVSASRSAPKGLDFMFGEVPAVTKGGEYLVFVPEENLETLRLYEKDLDVQGDLQLRVELVGVVEPPERDTL